MDMGASREAQWKREKIKGACNILAQQLVKSMDWAVPVGHLPRSVDQHGLSLLDLVARERKGGPATYPKFCGAVPMGERLTPDRPPL